MPASLQFVENPTITVVPPPNRGGRYRIEVRRPDNDLPCGHRSPQAVLWLTFVEAGREAGQEVSDVVCSACDPARFARLQVWAETSR